MSNVSVLLEPQQPEGFLATALGWSNCNAQGATEEEAIANLRQVLLARLQTAKIVSVDIYDEHPLVKMSGIFKDDPTFGAMLEFIKADRQALDDAMAEDEHQFDLLEGHSAA
jgi:predicted RNase H-like HicB family nuclease